MIAPELTHALSQLGLPTPRDTRPLRVRHGVADVAVLFGDTLNDDTIVLRRVLDGWGELKLERELAALSAIEGTAIPTPRGYRILRTLPFPAAIHAPVAGTAGIEVAARRPDLVPVVFTALGHVLRGIGEVKLPRWGHGASRRQFLPTAASPGAEWLREAHHHHALAASNGCDLGALGDELLATLRSAVPAIDADNEPRLVHRSLDAHAIWLMPRADGTVDVAGVLDWGMAIAGDPLADWAPGLFAPVDRVALTVRGFGVPEAEALFGHATASARLAAYGAALCLRYLASDSPGAGAERARAMLRLRTDAEALVSERFVERQLERVLDAVPHPQPTANPGSPLGLSVGWRALDVLRYPTAVSPGTVMPWIGALGAVRLTTTDTAALRGHAALDVLRVAGGPTLAPSAIDLASWTRSLAVRALSTLTADGQHRTAFIATGLALRALEALGRSADPGMCAGLEQLVLQLEVTRDQEPPLSNRELFLHALVARALFDSVKAAAGDGMATPDALDQQLHDGWYAIEPMVPAPSSAPWDATIDQLCVGPWDQLDPPGWVPAALFAIRALHDRLPAPPAEVLRALGLVPAPASTAS